MKRMLSFLIAIAFDERHFSLFFSDKNSIETAEVRTVVPSTLFKSTFIAKLITGSALEEE